MAGGSLARLERLAVLVGASFVRPARWDWIDPCLIAPIGWLGDGGGDWEGARDCRPKWLKIFWAVLASVIMDRSWRRPPQRAQ